ncbi:helix-turn-helix domain-containing protein [Arthrobacter sp. ISL-48]|nr:helix-turn-helix domain-containing protein [Arthrobacter sp. ISL-48]
MITVEDWALIRRLHVAEGESMRSIAARLGISRNTVAKAVTLRVRLERYQRLIASPFNRVGREPGIQ